MEAEETGPYFPRLNSGGNTPMKSVARAGCTLDRIDDASRVGNDINTPDARYWLPSLPGLELRCDETFIFLLLSSILSFLLFFFMGILVYWSG